MTIPSRYLTPVPTALILSLAGGACGGGTDSPGPPDLIQRLSGDAQSAVVGNTLPLPLTVQVLDPEGRGVPGVLVDFSVVSGGGTIAPVVGASSAVSAREAALFGAAATALVSDTTDESGRVSASWTLGTAAQEQTARATVALLGSVDFSAAALAGPPASVTASSGSLQVGRFGAALTQPITVLVRDQFSNVTPEVAVTWDLDEGDGTLSNASSETGSDGTASVELTLGPASVLHLVSATVGELTSNAAVAFAMSVIESDPEGDLVCDTCSTQFAKPDLVRLGGVLDVDFLLFFLEFANPVSFLSDQASQPSNAVFGFFDIDLDQDSATGIATVQDAGNLGSSEMGVDAFFVLNPASPDLPAGAPAGSIPVIRIDSLSAGGDTLFGEVAAAQAVLADDLMLFSVGLSFLQDDGNVNAASIVGAPDLATDFAPNAGNIPIEQAVTEPGAVTEFLRLRSPSVTAPIRVSRDDLRRWCGRDR